MQGKKAFSSLSPKKKKMKGGVGMWGKGGGKGGGGAGGDEEDSIGSMGFHCGLRNGQ